MKHKLHATNARQTTEDGEMKKWEHIPIRPSTFEEFRELKGQRDSDDAFVIILLRCYSKWLKWKKKQEVKNV